MTVVAYVLGVLVIAVGVALSIALHEIGHLVPAKTFGVKVTQYMVGFGPTVWSRKRGETEYGVKAVPLGGYIRMIGMFPPRRDTLLTSAMLQIFDRRTATNIEKPDTLRSVQLMRRQGKQVGIQLVDIERQ